MSGVTTTDSLRDPETNEKLFADIYAQSMVVARQSAVMPGLVRVFNDRTGAEARIASERGEVKATNVDEGTPIPLTEATKAKLASLTPGEYGASNEITTRAQRTDPDLVADYAMMFGQAMARKADQNLTASFANFTQDDIGDADDTFSVEHIEVAAALLRDQEIPGEMVCVMNERQWFGIRKDQSIDKDITNAPEELRVAMLRNRYMGNLGEVRLVVTPHVPTDVASEGATATAGLFIVGQALAMDVRQAPAYDAHWLGGRERKWEYSIVADGGFGVWRPNYGVPITTSSPVPAIDRSASYDA